MIFLESHPILMILYIVGVSLGIIILWFTPLYAWIWWDHRKEMHKKITRGQFEALKEHFNISESPEESASMSLEAFLKGMEARETRDMGS